MSKAAELLKKTLVVTEKKRKASTPKLEVRKDSKVNIPSFDRETTVAAAARYFKLLNRKVKSFNSELDVVKGVLRGLGQERLDEAMGNGEYYGAAELGEVKVTRANKYYPAPYERDDLKEAVGESYGAMFQEEAVLRFDSIDQLQQHLNMCETAGVPIEAERVVGVRGRPGLRQRMSEMWEGLDEERKQLLSNCAKDQAPRVGVK